jgi:hypothetical protein
MLGNCLVTVHKLARQQKTLLLSKICSRSKETKIDGKTCKHHFNLHDIRIYEHKLLNKDNNKSQRRDGDQPYAQQTSRCNLKKLPFV